MEPRKMNGMARFEPNAAGLATNDRMASGAYPDAFCAAWPASWAATPTDEIDRPSWTDCESRRTFADGS